MKKLLCIFLILCCFAGMVGCAEETITDSKFYVYYQREVPTYGSADSVIAQTYLLTGGRDQDIAYLLRKYLASTPGDGFVSPFPQSVTLVHFTQDGLTVKVVLSDELASLSGIKLTIALTCLTRTILDLTDCQEVIISANTKKLDGQNYITLSRDSYLLADNSGEAQNKN